MEVFDLYALIVLVVCINIVLGALVLYSFFRYHSLSTRSLKGKHVLVTGGSSGIGKAIAIEAIKRGANVSIVARDINRLKDAKQEILTQRENASQIVQIIPLDVGSKLSSVEMGIEGAENELGPIYMLINCAGLAIPATLENISESEIRKMMDTNYFGTIFPTKAVVEKMKTRGEGHIVFTSSQAGLLGVYGLSPYSASKYALRGLAEGLQMELIPYGVKVTLSFPPDTDTPGFAEENKTKPMETKLICGSSGLYGPDIVAKKTMDDALAGVFFSSVGFEGFLMCTLCAGMSPVNSIFNLLTQVFLMGLFRLVSAFYLSSFDRIIRSCFLQKNKSKKAE